MTYTETFTVDGRTYTATVSGNPACRECKQRIYARSRTDADDGMTERDWQQAQAAAAERAQRRDDAAFYGGCGRDDRNVGY